jgi:type I restriction enzyme S subunit
MKFKLSDVANVTMGQSPKSEFFNEIGAGTPFLQGVRTFGRLHPTIDTYTTEFNRLATQGSILFSVRAPVGQVNWADRDIAIGRGLAAIDPVPELVNSNYLYYLLKSMGAAIDSQSNGTVFTSINKTELNNLVLELPELAQQEKAGTTLRLLDDKIESLSEINDNLAA